MVETPRETLTQVVLEEELFASTLGYLASYSARKGLGRLLVHAGATTVMVAKAVAGGCSEM